MILITGTYRVIITALLFSIFGLGAVFISSVVYPVISLLERNRNKRIYLTRRMTAWSFKIFFLTAAFLRVLRLDIKNSEKTSGDHGVIYISNHPSLIDYVLLTSCIKNSSSCVIKGGLTFNPFLKGIIACNNYIPNNQDPGVILDKCRNLLNCGDNLLIFPEGTRTVDENHLKFTHGFARIALSGPFALRPVIIKYRGQAFRKHIPWYRVFSGKFEYEIIFEELFDTGDFVAKNHYHEHSALSRTLAREMQNFVLKCKQEK